MAPTAVKNDKITDSLVKDDKEKKQTNNFRLSDKLKSINNSSQESTRGMRPLLSNKRADPPNYEDQIQLPKQYKYIRLLGHGAYGIVW
jgi:hypothetical protein